MKFYFICGKLEGLNWGGVGSESRTPYTGAPPEASFPCSLLKGFQVAQPRKTGRVPATRKAQNELWRHSDSFSADLTGPWVPGAWWGNGEQGKGSGEETVPEEPGQSRCLASVHSWILSLCEVHGLETQPAYWERVQERNCV